MTDQELRKLKREDFIEIIYEYQRREREQLAENQAMQARLLQLNQQLQQNNQQLYQVIQQLQQANGRIQQLEQAAAQAPDAQTLARAQSLDRVLELAQRGAMQQLEQLKALRQQAQSVLPPVPVQPAPVPMPNPVQQVPLQAVPPVRQSGLQMPAAGSGGLSGANPEIRTAPYVPADIRPPMPGQYPRQPGVPVVPEELRQPLVQEPAPPQPEPQPSAAVQQLPGFQVPGNGERKTARLDSRWLSTAPQQQMPQRGPRQEQRRPQPEQPLVSQNMPWNENYSPESGQDRACMEDYQRLMNSFNRK